MTKLLIILIYIYILSMEIKWLNCSIILIIMETFLEILGQIIWRFKIDKYMDENDYLCELWI